MYKKDTKTLTAVIFLIGVLAVVVHFANASPAAVHSQRSATTYFAYVGTYTAVGGRRTGSEGIYLYRYNSNTAQFTPLGLAAKIENPTFMAIDPQHRFLYAVTEIGNLHGLNGSISSYAINRTSGALTFLNEVSSEGGNPAHLVVDHTDKMLLVANFISGSVISFAINPDGSIGRKTGFDQHEGSSVNPRRQKGPHAHAVVLSPDNRFVIVPDLGLDKVFVYRLKPNQATFVPNDPPYVTVPPGLGPRHFVFGARGKFGYLVCEMGSAVVAFSYDRAAGVLKRIQIISTLPEGFSGADNSAEIQIDPTGRFLYTSNRGNDSITLFHIDPNNGELTKIQVTPTGGKIPRHFTIDPSGHFLIAENQNSDDMVVFKLDADTGKLSPTAEIVKNPAPVCLLFVPAP